MDDINTGNITTDVPTYSSFEIEKNREDMTEGKVEDRGVKES